MNIHNPVNILNSENPDSENFFTLHFLQLILPAKSGVLNGIPDKTSGRPFSPKSNSSMSPRTSGNQLITRFMDFMDTMDIMDFMDTGI